MITYHFLIVIVFAFLGFVSVYLVKVLSVFFHELGHALMAHLTGSKSIVVTIGSYSDDAVTWNYKTGPIAWKLTRQPFLWVYGVCKYVPIKYSLRNKVLVTLMGPIFSLIGAVLCFLYTRHLAIEGMWEIIGIALTIIFSFDFLVNIIPRKNPVYYSNGFPVYNDGKSIWRSLKLRKYGQSYHNVLHLLQNKEYERAALEFETWPNHPFDETIYRTIATTYLDSGREEKALILIDRMLSTKNPHASDFVLKGYYYIKKEEYKEALDLLKDAVNQGQKTVYVYNSIAYCHLMLKDYESGCMILTELLNQKSKNVNALLNRGFAHAHLKNFDEALADLKLAHELEPDNAHYYQNMGLVYQGLERFEEALECFQRAKNIDNSLNEIDQQIMETQQKINLEK